MIPVSPTQNDNTTNQFLYSPVYQNQPLSPFHGLSPNYSPSIQNPTLQIVYISEPQAKLLFVLGFLFFCLWPINVCLNNNSEDKQVLKWVHLSVLCFSIFLLIVALCIIGVIIGLNYEIFSE